jgi:hypothetical protein
MFLGVCLRDLFVVLCLGHLVAACSSFDEDTPDHLDFALPSVEWTIPSNDPRWRRPPPKNVPFPGFVCSGPEALSTDCCAPPFDCQKYPVACDPTSLFCALTFDLETTAAVRLVDGAPAVASVRGRVFSRVELLTLTSTVSIPEDLPIREATLHIGPKDVAVRSDPAATFFALVSLAPGERLVTPDTTARDAFSTLARDYEQPFSLLLSTHFVVSDDDYSPRGFSVSLKGQARAYY